MAFDREVFLPLAALATVAFVKYAVLHKLSTRHRRMKEKQVVGKVSRLSLFPIKSLKGIDTDVIKCTTMGVENTESFRDRCFMVSNSDYMFVTARQYPRLLLIQVQCSNGNIILKAPNTAEELTLSIEELERKQDKLDTKVWGENLEGCDCGDEAAAWITNYLNIDGRKFRLVYHRKEQTSRMCKNGPSSFHKESADCDQIAYQDGFPFMMMTESSLDDLNTRLKEKGKNAIMDQFRPNIVVSGSPAFDEDNWNEVYVGDAVFYNIKPCDRCIMTTIDPKIGVKDPDMEPLKTLRSYRLLVPEFEKSPCFGINLVVRKEGTVKVGDLVYATRK